MISYSKLNKLKYVLITPARNEEEFIEKTIQSVVRQTVLPLKWFIVIDGSPDKTDTIIKHYLKENQWIELIKIPESNRKQRDFASKVYAFNAGQEKARKLDYDIIGNLDADISFDADYFEYLLEKFYKNDRLGVGGTPFKEGKVQYDFRFASTNHVSGACQLFRRECFEDIGGYTPLKRGGIDLLAVMTARMMGWYTQTYSGKICFHNKVKKKKKKHAWKDYWKSGYHDYLMGSHFVFQLFRSLYHMTNHPYVLRGSALILGYIWALVTMPKKYVSRELKQFRQKEQLNRIQSMLKI